jgi:hypothetical protein
MYSKMSCLFGLRPSRETAVMDQFRLEGVEEALRRRILPTVALPTHAADVTFVLQER